MKITKVHMSKNVPPMPQTVSKTIFLPQPCPIAPLHHPVILHHAVDEERHPPHHLNLFRSLPLYRFTIITNQRPAHDSRKLSPSAAEDWQNLILYQSGARLDSGNQSAGNSRQRIRGWR